MVNRGDDKIGLRGRQRQRQLRSLQSVACSKQGTIIHRENADSIHSCLLLHSIHLVNS